MSSADACETAYTRGLDLSILSLSMPVTFTGDRIVFMMSHDQRRAQLCWMRPLRSKSEQSREIVPRIRVYAQISGSRMKYDRRRLGQPWRGLGATGCVSGQVETVAGCS